MRVNNNPVINSTSREFLQAGIGFALGLPSSIFGGVLSHSMGQAGTRFAPAKQAAFLPWEAVMPFDQELEILGTVDFVGSVLAVLKREY
jgi:hypothetical protein